MATSSNLFVDQGSYFSRFLTIQTPSGTAYPLDGYTVASQMRKNGGTSIGYTIQATIVDAPLGRIKLFLESADSEVIPSGRYFYDVEITDDDGEKLRVLEGIIVINPQMTKV